MHHSDMAVPDEVDQAVMASARRRLRTMNRRRLMFRLVTPIAAAAGVALAFILYNSDSNIGVHGEDPARAAPRPQTYALREDFDGNGQVDILDAFALARRLKSSVSTTTVGRQWDINGDGEVNKRDVDFIAATAVRLDTTTRRG
jgi:hypothetical protein